MSRHSSHPRRASHPPISPRGFSLPEVLVALTLFVNGLLLILALHTAGLEQQHRAYLDTQALLQDNPQPSQSGAHVHG